MPDSAPPSISQPADQPRNLPVPVPPSSETGRERENWLARVWQALIRWKAGSIRADLEVALEAGAPGAGGFSPEESALLRNILNLRERRVEDVMVPRADIVAVQHDITIGALIRTFESAGHSRLVVYNDTLDDPLGMIHIRDLIGFLTARATANAKRKRSSAGLDLKAVDLSMPLSETRIVRAVLFVPPSMPAIDLLAKMQATRIHLALVIDEYGGTDGLASIEDIVEQIVGDIEDEHDTDETPGVVAQADGSFLADARATLEDVTTTVGSEFDTGEASKDVDTLGGYLVTQVGRVPVRGELVPGPGSFEIEVLDADPRRVKKVRIHRGRDRARLARRRDGDGERVAPTMASAPTADPGASDGPDRPMSDAQSTDPRTP
jgi:CBS domain containing-hemolysin-like protein